MSTDTHHQTTQASLAKPATVQVQALERVFRYNGVDLPDPGQNFSPDQVKDLFTTNFPEMTTAVIEGPTESNGKLMFEFRRAVGTKG
jgi:PRTRC genetic system protein C